MTDTPPDWVLIEAAKRIGWPTDNLEPLRERYRSNSYLSHAYRALCDMIQKYEQPPVDRKLLCAREARRQHGYYSSAYDDVSIRAIELWEEGFGRD